MKYRSGNTIRVALLVAGLCAGLATLDAQGQGETWSIGPREVPPPAGTSDVLRDSIGTSPAPNVKARASNVPQTEEQWRAMISARANSRSVSFDALEQQYKVSIKRDTIEGIPVFHVTPNTVNPAHAKHLFLHVHGGAYVFGGGDAAVTEAVVVASSSGIPALSIDYRMPPDHPFPTAVDDVVTVYRQLLKKMPGASIAIGGTSAGGGLALASVHKFRDLNLPVPGAIYAGTPWADLTKTGDTLFTNEGLDRILVTYDGSLGASARLYANGHDMKDPLLSPVYGDFENFPPTILITGTRDMFLSDTARTHRKLRAAGVVADLHVYEGMSHAGYLVAGASPESRDAFAEVSAFLTKHLK